MATVVDSVAESRHYGTVINQKRGHLHTLFVKDDALLDVMAHHLDAVTGSLFVHVAAHVNVKGERLQNVIHHVARTLWPPDLERDPAPTADPTSQEQVRDLDHVVGMEVGEEQAG